MFSAFRLLAAFLAVSLLCLSASGATAEKRRLLDEGEQARWAAVGRLNIGGQGHCTGTLIAPDLVLTAAHCVVNARTGALWRAERLHFLAGWRTGRYAAHLRGTALALAEGYAEAPGFARDIALIRVERAEGSPPPPEPLPVSDVRPRAGMRAATLSYGRDRAEALSMERDCRTAAVRPPLILTACEATPGVSGAPLLRPTPQGAELLGVIVAAEDPRPPEMRGAALAVHAAAHLPALRAALEAAER